MNILFLTIHKIDNIGERGLYEDLIRKFRVEGHDVFIVSPIERRYNFPSGLINSRGVKILKVKTLNLIKTNFIEKGIGTLLMEYQYQRAIDKFLNQVKFDLILYSTPPITFSKIISRIKKRDLAKSYLLLKDIFPQNAVDLGLIKENSLLHSFFKKKERELYEISDFIGCMSPANVQFVISNNAYLNKNKVEVCPNCTDISKIDNEFIDKEHIRKKYNLPLDAIIFIYGGNLGKPQGIGFLLEVLQRNNHKQDRFFLIVGSGTEYKTIQDNFHKNNYTNAKLIPGLIKEEYDLLIRSCDVGLIFLDRNFSIPNYPSRLLSYLENKMPILAATDVNSDVGKIADENNYGYWVESGDLEKFDDYLEWYLENPDLIKLKGENGYKFLVENYTVDISYDIIMKHFN